MAACGADTTGRAPSAARWVLLLTSIACVFNYFDRYLLVILTEPIKRDLGLSDTQMGLLSGLAFAVVYCTLSVPISHIADRGHRVRVLGGSLGLWSVMTALCGSATGFGSLVAARVGVAVGEAGGLPTVHALISEYYPEKVRARALSVISGASVIGLALAMVFGGLLNDWVGWRRAFWLAAIPGLIVSFLIWFTIREPVVRTSASPLRIREGLGALYQRRAYVWLLVGLAVAAIGAFGAQAWAPALLMRNYQVSASTVGLTYSIVSTGAMFAGTLVGGALSDRMAARDPRGPFRLLAGSFIVSLPFYIAFVYASSLVMSLVWAAPAFFFAAIYVSAAYAQVQNLAGAQLRATAAAVYITVVNLLGLGLGPTLTGMISDAIDGGSGAGLSHALAILLAISFPTGSALLLLGTRTIKADLAAAERA